jgi:hypothetical protein
MGFLRFVAREDVFTLIAGYSERIAFQRNQSFLNSVAFIDEAV